jgi:tRNA 2-thiouridine synthesizing protein A
VGPSRLECPLPIVRTKKAINATSSGQIIRIVATDRGSVLDFKAFSTQTGNELLASSEAGGVYTLVIENS